MSSPRYKHFGKVEQGRLVLHRKEQFQAALSGLNGKEVELTLAPRKDERTRAQNNYYWAAIVKPLGDEFGYDPDEMHSILKSKFLRRWSQGKLGVFPYAQSTTTLNTEGFEDYCERIRTWAMTDFNIRLALPGEVEVEE